MAETQNASTVDATIYHAACPSCFCCCFSLLVESRPRGSATLKQKQKLSLVADPGEDCGGPPPPDGEVVERMKPLIRADVIRADGAITRVIPVITAMGSNVNVVSFERGNPPGNPGGWVGVPREEPSLEFSGRALAGGTRGNPVGEYSRGTLLGSTPGEPWWGTLGEPWWGYSGEPWLGVLQGNPGGGTLGNPGWGYSRGTLVGYPLGALVRNPRGIRWTIPGGLEALDTSERRTLRESHNGRGWDSTALGEWAIGVGGRGETWLPFPSTVGTSPRQSFCVFSILTE